MVSAAFVDSGKTPLASVSGVRPVCRSNPLEFLRWDSPTGLTNNIQKSKEDLVTPLCASRAVWARVPALYQPGELAHALAQLEPMSDKRPTAATPSDRILPSVFGGPCGCFMRGRVAPEQARVLLWPLLLRQASREMDACGAVLGRR